MSTGEDLRERASNNCSTMDNPPGMHYLRDAVHKFPEDLFPKEALHGYRRNPQLGEWPSIGWVITSADSERHQPEFLTVEVQNLAVIVRLLS